MTAKHGGFRKGAGRPKGSKNRATIAREARRRRALKAAREANANLEPLDYLLQVMRDPTTPPGRRAEVAKFVAPYVEARMVLRRTRWAAVTFNYRNFDRKLVSEPPQPGDEARMWSRERYLAMDTSYRDAVITAIEQGLERLPEPAPEPKRRSVPVRMQHEPSMSVASVAPHTASFRHC